MLSENDLRLQKLLLTSNFFSPQEIQTLLEKEDVQQNLSKGMSLFEALQNGDYLSLVQLKTLLAQHLLIECPKCRTSFRFIGPDLPEKNCRVCHQPFLFSPKQIQQGEMTQITSHFELQQEGRQTAKISELSRSDNTVSNAMSPPNLNFLELKKSVPPLLGEYLLLEKLGAGGMGTVYLAEQQRLKKKVALKVIYAPTSDSQAIPRFFLEAQAIAKIDHPNVVKVYDIGQSEDFYFISMQYIEGYSMEHLLMQRGKLEWQKACSMIHKVAEGLFEAHCCGILHRDIKPENIMISHKGEIKITDFGLVRDLAMNLSFSRTGDILGTPYFMSPEQSTGKKVNHQSDIYSLGVTFYYMLTGQKPFDAENLAQLLLKHLQEQPHSPRVHVPDLPEAIEITLSRMLAKDPLKRYASLQDFVRDMEHLMEGVPLKSTLETSTFFREPSLKTSEFIASAQKNERVFSGKNQFWREVDDVLAQLQERVLGLLHEKKYKEAQVLLYEKMQQDTSTETHQKLRPLLRKVYEQLFQQKLGESQLKETLELTKQAYQEFPEETKWNPTTFLEKALQDPEEKMRRRAIQLLGSAQIASSEIITMCFKTIAQESDEYLQLALAKIIAQQNFSPAVFPVFENALKHSQECVRYWGVFALGAIKDFRSIPLLCKQLEDPSKKVKRKTIEILGNFETDTSRIISHLQRFCQDPDAEIAQLVQRVLQKMT